MRFRAGEPATVVVPHFGNEHEDPGRGPFFETTGFQRLLDVSPDGRKLLIERTIFQRTTCFDAEEEGLCRGVNTDDGQRRVAVVEANTSGGAVTELPAFSTPFGRFFRREQDRAANPDPVPPLVAPLRYSPDGREVPRGAPDLPPAPYG